MTDIATIEELSAKLETVTAKLESESSKRTDLETQIKELKSAAKTKKDKNDDPEDEMADAKKLSDAQKKLEKTVSDLTAKLELSNKMPIINKIVEAKMALENLGKESEQAEIEKLSKMPIEELNTISSAYANLVQKSPQGVTVKYPAPSQHYSQASKEQMSQTSKFLTEYVGATE